MNDIRRRQRVLIHLSHVHYYSVYWFSRRHIVAHLVAATCHGCPGSTKLRSLSLVDGARRCGADIRWNIQHQGLVRGQLMGQL